MATNVRGSNVFRYGNEGAVGVVWTVREEGANVNTMVNEIDFVGPGVTAAGAGSVIDITIPPYDGLTVQNEGVDQSTNTTELELDFVGGGASLSGSGDVTTISVSALDVTLQREGVDALTGVNTLNFIGRPVSASKPASGFANIAYAPTIPINFDNGGNSIDYPTAGNTVFHGTNTYYAVTGSKRETSTVIGNLAGQRPVTRQTCFGYGAGAGSNTFGQCLGRSCNAQLEDVVVGNYSNSSGVVVGNSSYGSGVTIGGGSNSSSGVVVGHGSVGNGSSVGVGMGTTCSAGNVIALGLNAVATTWVLDTSGPLAISGASTMLGGSAPAIPANATNLWRVRLNGTNYTIPLMVDQ